MLHPPGRGIPDAPPGEKGKRPEQGQVDWHWGQVFGQGEPRRLPPSGGGGGDRADLDRLPLPGRGHLCLRPVAHRIYAPVYRRRLFWGAEGVR